MKCVLKTFEIKDYNPKTDKLGKESSSYKQELINKFHAEYSSEDLKQLEFDQFKIDITFHLYNDKTNTKWKSDLDNLLKPVLDVLSVYRNNKKQELGLGIIQDDHQIFELNARKAVVDNQLDAGITITIQEHAPDRPQPA